MSRWRQVEGQEPGLGTQSRSTLQPLTREYLITCSQCARTEWVTVEDGQRVPPPKRCAHCGAPQWIEADDLSPVNRQWKLTNGTDANVVGIKL